MKNEAGMTICGMTKADRKRVADYIARLRKDADEFSASSDSYARHCGMAATQAENAIRHVLALLGWKVKEGTFADGSYGFELVPRLMGKMTEV